MAPMVVLGGSSAVSAFQTDAFQEVDQVNTFDPILKWAFRIYEDENALTAHRAHLKEMGIDLRALLDGSPVLEFYEKLL
ncbi:hypothetical protein C2W62_54225 [Candidatus Entotheonella serta]|nr:hypothetical protein C2W62_54225 [Candidatus Entotheonella serta]